MLTLYIPLYINIINVNIMKKIFSFAIIAAGIILSILSTTYNRYIDEKDYNSKYSVISMDNANKTQIFYDLRNNSTTPKDKLFDLGMTLTICG